MQSLQIGQVIKPANGLPRNVSRTLRAQVVLGSPAAGCRDVGVCRVIPADVSLALKCPIVKAWLSVTEEGLLRIGFEYDTLGLQEFQKHFRWGLFQVMEPCEMPHFVRRFFKVHRMEIREGVYPVFVKGARLVVDFKITTTL